TVHQVEVLHGCAGGAFDQIVEAADREDAAADETHSNVAKVCVGRVLGARQMIDDADERLVGIGFAESLEQLSFGYVANRLGVGRREDAAVHGNEMRGEDQVHRFAGGAADDLFDFGRVAVAANIVGRDAFIAFREMPNQLGHSARPGHAAFAVDDDVGWLNEAGLHERGERQDGGGGVAAGVGDELGAGDLFAEEFGQAVNDFAEALGVGMLVPVPLFEGRRVIEAVI